MTLSPTATSSGTRLPLSSMRPGPIARTSPSWGFSLAVSGITRPDAVVGSASLDLTTMRSSRGLMETDTCDLPFGNVEDGQERTLSAICGAIYQAIDAPASVAGATCSLHAVSTCT